MTQIQITINVGEREDGYGWLDVDPGSGRLEHLTFTDYPAAVEAQHRLLEALKGQLRREELVSL